ncbi:sugar-binding transcriptional regulator [Brevibacillus choshinensis]|uniref:sugar-binding transcriptional regulator n=1 Tax=Brevibacillus choshinensis TaxID=54911 RepID=UPI002E1E4237|nr:sugar-binding transcriptional regulator [Brevibacillus choshinensis]MED4750730.1 sugar-binding transcriptional regulator [Brevibacillus choshinensis]
MDNWTEKRELVRVAKLYYLNGLTQAEIAKKLGVSRPVISKMLQRAKDTGIVEIYIRDETVSMVELEQQLEAALRLDEVIVVPSYGNKNEELIKQQVAKAAAQYLPKWIRNKRKIGISWGTTLYHLVNEYPFERHHKMKVYPLVGGIGRHRIEIHSNQLAYEFSKKLGGSCEFLYAPAIADSMELKRQLIDSPDIRSILEEARHVELAIVGIGNPYESTMTEMGYLKEEDLRQLQEGKAVGDISSRFIDKTGKPILNDLNNRVIGIELDELRHIPTVVGVVSGSNKLDAVWASLQGNYFDKLIIDEYLAEVLLEKTKEVSISERG